MTRREIGENYFKQGYNCAQSVVLAFKDLIGIEEEKAVKLISGFGGGFGRMREVCGAVSGMVYVISAVEGYTSPTADTEKMELYKTVQTLMKEFKAQNGSYICAELMDGVKQDSPTPEKRTQEYYEKRPCALLVGDACEILEKYLSK